MKESSTFWTLINIQKQFIYNFARLSEMATSSSSQKKQAEDVPEYVIHFKEVASKPTNHLPLLPIPEGKSYFQDARNLLINGLCKTSLTLNIPANKELLFTFWATSHVLTGYTDKGTAYEYIQGFIPSKDAVVKLVNFDITLPGFRQLMGFPRKPANATSYESLPTEDEMIEFLDSINYQREEDKYRSVKTNHQLL